MTDLSRRKFMQAMCMAGLGAGAAANKAGRSEVNAIGPIRHVHVVFKTHLDIGFTALAKDVIRNYFERFIPDAISLATHMRERGGKERFVWTTGSWLIYEYLEQASAGQRRDIEHAIEAGDIYWHALPFTTHTELMDPGFARFALSLSARLDRRFGRRTLAAKMSDVPGHTRSLIPFLDDAGVTLLHIGVNRASRDPSVPRAFRWKGDTGASVVVLYSTGYGAAHVLPGFDHALVFAHSGDNHGPQNKKQVMKAFGELHERFPDAEITAGSMDDFARAMPTRVISALPVVTSEIGDTWIHGVGTDPANVARLREFMRLSSMWSERSVSPRERAALDAATRHALLVCEHTWGLDVKTHLADWDKYDREAFDAARAGAKYCLMESSWQEKRTRIDTALSTLGGGMRQQARRAMEKLGATPLDLKDFELAHDADERIDAGQLSLGFSCDTGAITALRDRSGREWASPASPLGLATYQAFSAAFFEKYYAHYNPKKRETGEWARPDFGKPGLETTGAVDQLALPRLKDLYKARNRLGSTRIAAVLDFPDVKSPAYGQPARIEVRYEIRHKEPVVDVMVQWFDKPPCRLPEALWFSFQPVYRGLPRCSVSKLGQDVDVHDVVSDGNRYLHAVDDRGVRVRDDTHTFRLYSIDAPLVAVGRRMLVKTDDRLPDPRGGLHVNLFNNVWNTNFRLWYGENASFRFRIEFSA